MLCVRFTPLSNSAGHADDDDDFQEMRIALHSWVNQQFHVPQKWENILHTMGYSEQCRKRASLIFKGVEQHLSLLKLPTTPASLFCAMPEMVLLSCRAECPLMTL